MIVVGIDIETAPQEGALERYAIDAEPVRLLLEKGEAACTPEAVDAACEPLRKTSQSGWKYGRTKDPAKLFEALSRDYEELASSASKACSFDPLLGRVVSIAFGYRDLKTGEMLGEVKTLADFAEGDVHDETALLGWAWSEWLALAECLVSWNGIGFDLPFLLVRSAMLGVEPTGLFDTPRYRYTPHLDLMQWLSGWERSKWTGLDKACARAGVGVSKGGMDGSQVASYVDEGRWEEIAAYNLADVIERTWPLYELFACVIPGHQEMARRLAEARVKGAKGGQEDAA